MANIENLNFQVILDDSAFQERINKDIADAQQLTDSLDKILRMRINSKPIVTAAGVTNAQNMSKYLDEISTKLQNMPKGALFVGDAEKLNATLAQINATLEKMNTKQKTYTGSVQGTNAALFNAARLVRTLSTLTGAAFSVAGLRRFLSSLIDITGQFEVQRMALRNMLQDVDGADKIFDDLYRFASDSTYRFSELAKYAKQLSAFNIDQNNLLETTKMLGDVASGVGVSMDRLILAYGHVKSSGFLRGIQLRSFSQNGVPVLDELAKMFSEVEHRAVSLGEVFDKMTKREIPFEMVEEAFRRMTSEGGKFYQMQEVLSKTLAGQINILKGRWENLLAAIGQANSGVLKDTVAWMSNLVSNMDNFGRLLKQLVVGFTAYQVALIAAVGFTKGFAAALDVGVLGALKKVAVAIMANPFAVLGAAAVAASVVIYGLVTAMSDVEKIQNSLTKSIGKFNDSVSSEIGELDALYAKLKLAREGTKEYDAAKQAIVKRFGPYIEQLRSEGVEVNNLANIYKNLAEKIREANKEKFLESSLQDLSTQWGSAESALRSRFNKTISDMEKNLKRELTAIQKESLWRFVTGTVTDDNRLIVNSVVSNLEHSLKNTQKYVNPKNATSGPHYMAAEQKQDASYLMKDIRGLAKEYQETSKVYADSVVAAHEAFDILERGANKDGEKEEEELVYRISSIIEGIKKLDVEIEKIRGKARKGSITQGEKDKLDELLKDRAAQAKEYEDIMGVKYDKDTRSVARGETAAEKAVRDKIASIKGDIALLEKFKSAYDKLEPIYGEDAAKAWVFNNMGKDVSNLDKEFEDLIADLRKLGDEGVEAADAAEARLGLDKASKAVKEYNAAQKALEQYERAFEKFDKDWGEGEQEGAGYKVEKAFRDYNNEDKKIDDDYLEAQMKAFEAHKDNVDAIKEETDELYELYKARKKANKSKLKETVRGLADDIFKEQMKGFDLTDWNDKTIWQINKIREAIEQVEIPEDIKKELEGDTEAANALMVALNELKQKTLNNTVDPEMFKKVSKEAKRLAGYLATASDKMRELAIATGNTKMGDFAEVVGMLAQNMQAAADGAEAWGGWWGAIIGGITDIFDQMVTGLTDAISATRELKKIVREIKTDSFILSNSSMFSNDSIFGENQTKNMRGAVDAMKNLRESMVALGDPEVSRRMSFWEKTLGFSLRLVYKNAQTTADEFAKGGKLSEVMSKYGLNVYDEYGNFDPASIREVIKLFGDEDGMLEKLAKDAEAYAEAMKVVDEIAESIVGGVVSDITDKIVDSWWEAGRAALDYADILEDVAKSYAKLIVRDMLLDAAFDEQRQDAFKKALTSGDARKAMAIVEEAMQSAQDMLPAVESALQAFEPYRNMGGGDESNSVGNGIKNITEDTANLLASYINAIRADVSYMRGLQERSLEGVAALSGNIPTLNDYLAQCAANTYNTVDRLDAVINRLDSVIGPYGTSGMVVRVENYR